MVYVDDDFAKGERNFNNPDYLDYVMKNSNSALKRSASDYASQTNAKIKRETWADYTNRFMPVHQELIGAVSSPDLVNQQLGRVGGNINNSFDQAQSGMNANRSRMGLADLSQDNSLDKALATTHAKNSIREAGEQRSRTAITGAANSIAPTRSGV